MLNFRLFIFCFIKFTIGFKLASENTDFVKDESKIFIRTIRFNNSVPDKLDSNRCTFIKLKPGVTQYITALKPIADKAVAHHMSLVGCKYPPEIDEFDENTNNWDCGTKASICGPRRYKNDVESRRLYTWALNAEGVEFEDGVGIRVGGDTGLNYLAVQVHYAKGLTRENPDSYSRYILTMTSQDLPYQVGVYTLGNNGIIPPQQEAFKFESGCKFDFPYKIVPINYRTHAHEIVSVISGYLIKKEDDKWIELGRMSPHQPQAFYPVTNKNQIVNYGDKLAARCTMNTMDRFTITRTGQRHQDEMCVFYLMFYTDFKGKLKDFYCYPDGNEYKWSEDLKVKNRPPDNASSLKGVHLIDVSLEPDYTNHKPNHHHEMQSDRSNPENYLNDGELQNDDKNENDF